MPDEPSGPPRRPVLLCVGTEADGARALALGVVDLLDRREATVLSVWAPQPLSHNPVAAVTDVLFDGLDAANEARHEAAIAAAAAARTVLTAAGWSVATRIVRHEGEHWGAQAQVARELDPSVVVVGEPAERRRVRAVCSHETRALAHHVRAPLLILPSSALPIRPGAPVLAAFDGSDGARHALATATDLLADRPTEVVTAWTPVRAVAPIAAAGTALAIAAPDPGTIDADARAASEETARAGARLIAAAGGSASGSAQEAPRTIWEALLERADGRDCAVLVAGTRGRDPIRAILPGSVAEGLLRHARRPLLLVPHERTRR